MSNPRSAIGAAWLAVLLLGACDSPTPTETLTYPTALAEFQRGSRPTYHRGIDAEFDNLAQKIPGFAGVYLEGDVLHILGTDASRVDAQRSDVLERFPATDVVIEEVDRSFHQLAAVANIIRSWGYANGITMLDIDERANVVLVGYDPEDGGGAREIQEFLVARGVDTTWVELKPAGPALLLSDLQDPIRPAVGGLEIDDDYSPGGECTVWSISGPSWERMFATAGHCFDGLAVNDSVVVYQSKGGEGRIGWEVIDPAFADYPNDSIECDIVSCRLTDMMLGLYDDTVKAKRGFIARPSSKSRSASPLTISGEFRVAYKFPYATVGLELNKVGRTTGWTYGEVTHTCVDRTADADGAYRLCSDFAEGGVGSGDSGSPVFRIMSGNDVGMYGILWGSDSEFATCAGSPVRCDGYLFSTFDGIDEEFGGAMWPVYFQASISGSNYIPRYLTASWTANPAGGYAPHEFRWYVDGTLRGSDSIFTYGGFASSFWLRLEAEDQFGWYDDDSWFVTVYSW